MKKPKVWLAKWDYTRYNFKDIDDEYNHKNDSKSKRDRKIGYNYGRRLKNNKKNLLNLRKNTYTDISEGDSIFVYFFNIPGGDNQIFLKLSNLQLKDENGNLVWKYDEDDMIQKYIDARKIEWVLDENNPLRFTRGGLIKEGYELKERPSIQEITDETLINALNSNLRTYADLSNKMKKYGKCVFEGMIDSNKNHESFKRKNNLPYLEQHHFILQEIYKNYKNNNNEKELKKIIYSTDNILLLCPRCHRMIHQANEETVKQMIDLLKNSNHYYTLFKNVERVEKMINKKNLINEMYNINK